MKKVLSVVLVLLLLISFACPVSALSFSSENDISSVELSIKRLNAHIRGKSQIELADEILSELGMSERYIQNIPVGKKESVASSCQIHIKSEYVKRNEDGEEILISKREYDDYDKNNGIFNSSTYGILDVAAKEDDGKDSLFRRNLYIFKPLGDVKGEYIVLGSYEYKNMPFWRGTDVLSVSGEDLVFSKSSFSATVLYDIETTINGKYEKKEITENYDLNSIENANDLLGFTNAIAFKYNLPNDGLAPSFDGTGGGYISKCSNLAFMVLVTANINKPDQTILFNIYFNYFHQKLGLGSLGVSVSANGASVSVSPKTCYEMHQIMLDECLIYKP